MKAKSITYWTTTILVAFFMSGGIAQVLRLPPTIDGFHRVLGYPVYFVVILGVWKILGAIAILVPGLPRLKEWAYAGIFFDLTGAAVTNAAAADYGAYAFHIIAPLVITVLLIASWALRPPSRILGTPSL